MGKYFKNSENSKQKWRLSQIEIVSTVLIFFSMQEHWNMLLN